VVCDGLIGDLPKTCVPIRNDLAKGGQTILLYDGLKWFHTRQKPGGDVERKDTWHDERFNMQIIDTTSYLLNQDLALKNRFSLVQHEFWDGGFKCVKLVEQHTLLEGNPGRGFE